MCQKIPFLFSNVRFLHNAKSYIRNFFFLLTVLPNDKTSNKTNTKSNKELKENKLSQTQTTKIVVVWSVVGTAFVGFMATIIVVYVRFRHRRLQHLPPSSLTHEYREHEPNPSPVPPPLPPPPPPQPQPPQPQPPKRRSQKRLKFLIQFEVCLIMLKDLV